MVMQGVRVNPSLEKIWRDEVLYLHSLWHKGPPKNPNSIPRKNPNSKPISHSLAPSSSTPFKKENKKNKKKKIKDQSTTKNNKNDDNSIKSPASDVEWPCEPIPEPRKEIGWPELDSKSVSSTRPPTAEELEIILAVQLQQNGINAFRSFFLSKVSSDNEGDYEEGDNLMEEDDDEAEEYKLLLGIFTEDSDLRNYYEKHNEGGAFCCLVCGGSGKKVGKRYKDCVALVQHSIGISKTNQKRAHRAYGRVICKVLGWDVNRLPTIVLSLGDPLGRSLAKANSQDGDQREDLHEKAIESVHVDTNELGNKENDNVDQSEDQQDTVPDSLNDDKDEPMESQGISEKDGANDQGEDLQKAILDPTEQ